MPIFAVINGEQVENIIVAETIEDAENVTLQKCVDITDIDGVKIGTPYDGNEFEVELFDFPDSNPDATLAE
jgi:hypothetical protein